jgi:hypothetical protein
MDSRSATAGGGAALGRLAARTDTPMVVVTVVGRFDVGDHVVFVLEAETGTVGDASQGQLGFQAVQDLEPGHEP